MDACVGARTRMVAVGGISVWRGFVSELGESSLPEVTSRIVETGVWRWSAILWRSVERDVSGGREGRFSCLPRWVIVRSIFERG